LSGGPKADDVNYNHHNVEGARPRSRKEQRAKKWERVEFATELLSDPGGAVIGAALGFAGRAVGKSVKKHAKEQAQAKAARAQAAKAEQQFAQAQADQDAIVARYPLLRTCTKDQVVFLDGGYRYVPISEMPVAVTLPEADAMVERLR
jgi:hypothetical protein